jgi:hypothetical protein
MQQTIKSTEIVQTVPLDSISMIIHLLNEHVTIILWKITESTTVEDKEGDLIGVPGMGMADVKIARREITLCQIHL